MHDYRERLYVPLAWWLLATPTVLILGATLYAGLAEPWPVIIMVGFAAGCATLLITLGLATVEVGDGALRSGGAVLPLSAISEVVALDEKQSARLRGPRADPEAHLYSRPYLKESVYLAVNAGARPRSTLLADRHQASGGASRRHRKVPGASRARTSGMIARTSGREGGSGMADRKVDFGTKITSAVAAMAAAFVARKLITFVWTKTTGKEPPTHPEDPRVALTEALGWSVLTGVSVEAARLLATRAAARRTYSGPDSEPVDAADS